MRNDRDGLKVYDDFGAVHDVAGAARRGRRRDSIGRGEWEVIPWAASSDCIVGTLVRPTTLGEDGNACRTATVSVGYRLRCRLDDICWGTGERAPTIILGLVCSWDR